VVLLLLTATVFDDVSGLTVWTLHQETLNAASYYYCATPFLAHVLTGNCGILWQYSSGRLFRKLADRSPA
ncbi:hypothetical protein, partial [Trichocoleus sp. FACHB-262]|uniref:hypothetical protein n=1 Tax=Trichocoleus sp. FACHB-262 TaxID=2692869 RepID=UPI001A7EB464